MTASSDLPGADDFDRLESELFERIAVRQRRQVRRHRLVVVVAVLAIAGAGIAAGTIASTTQQSAFAYCYEGSTTTSRVGQLALPTGAKSQARPGTANRAARVSNALFICKAAWRGGVFSSSSRSGPFPVPRLQVCLRDDLVVSVFRATNSHESATAFCENLGLSAP